MTHVGLMQRTSLAVGIMNEVREVLKTTKYTMLA